MIQRKSATSDEKVNSGISKLPSPSSISGSAEQNEQSTGESGTLDGSGQENFPTG